MLCCKISDAVDCGGVSPRPEESESEDDHHNFVTYCYSRVKANEIQSKHYHVVVDCVVRHQSGSRDSRSQ